MKTDERVANEDAEHAEHRAESAATLVTLPTDPRLIDLHVIITDRETAVPVVGAQLMRKRLELAVTDAEGRAICVWDTGTYDDLFEIVAHGYGKAIGRVDMEVGGPEHPITIQLVRAATLYGHVKGLVGDGPCAAQVTTDGNLLMNASGVHEPVLRDTSWWALIDSVGRFEFFDLPPGVPLAIGFKEQGVEPRSLQLETIELEPGEVRELEWDLATDSAVAGRVTDPDGHGIEGLLIRVMVGVHVSGFRPSGGKAAAEGVTDANGEFRFDSLASGHYVIGRGKPFGSPDALGIRVVPIAVELRAGEALTDLQLIAYAGTYIEGRVITVEGSKPGFVLVIAKENDASWYSARSGADGTFSIGPLLPGEYAVEALPRDHLDGAPPPPVHVVAPAEGIEIQLISAGTIAGHIVDPATGEYLSGMVAVSLSQGGGTRLSDCRGQAGFESRGLTSAEYSVLVVAQDGRVGHVESIALEPGGRVDQIDVPVQPSGVLLVRFEQRAGEFLRTRVGSIDLIDISAPAATTAHFQVPAGPVTLELVKRSPNLDASLEEVLVRRVVDVPAGETIEVQLED